MYIYRGYDKISHRASTRQFSWQVWFRDQLSGTSAASMWASCWRHCVTMWGHISYSVKLPNRCTPRPKAQNHKLIPLDHLTMAKIMKGTKLLLEQNVFIQ